MNKMTRDTIQTSLTNAGYTVDVQLLDDTTAYGIWFGDGRGLILDNDEVVGYLGGGGAYVLEGYESIRDSFWTGSIITGDALEEAHTAILNKYRKG